MTDYLKKDVRIHICKDGTLSICEPGEKPFNGVALPIYTVDTVKEAQSLITLVGAVQYQEHPLMPGCPWHVMAGFSGEIEGIPAARERLTMAEKLLKERVTPD